MDSLLAVGCQGNVGAACVAAIEGPFRLSMTNDEDSRRRHVGGGNADGGQTDGEEEGEEKSERS